ncbi:DUF6292 family protein [Streptomyces natalensis]|uniref:DUF6292 domain-containing protein n=1 Tax=Streptomyces natalensis ATCC 27448 TaxID=1240678 RepID=A0A0D7CCE9_9ACTN|nr:DUF6292 family protein [Streptomyces natalensis]KIZ13706.1 hypothetical protein SNA_37525 [Streptomyces natalensis ATCC 27448]
MADSTEYVSHEPYIQAVADALDAAGLTVADWGGSDDDPRDAYIEFDRAITAPAYGIETEVSLLWTEERGWMVGWGDKDSVPQNGLDWVIDLSTGVLPTPDEMAAEARTVVAKIPGPQGGPYGRYRDSCDDDNFESQLAQYAGKDR